MRNKTANFMLLAALLPMVMAVVEAGDMQMPSRFTSGSDPGKLLNSYPLGKLNRLAVLSHHGKADEETRLPNGLTGWVYDKSIHRVPRVYVSPDRTEQVVNERKKSGPINKYTLVFSSDGV